ncbi:low temperature requirement protein A [Plastoroseomonas hellenica]|uniref:low temperature requirement protein A n=1 Tax=Plastoroseomonas hellenica TaxID=2687306 RepID=UPI001BAAC01A|nr:low temperature requirement protein A [Plastoroseomonas hellenica]MBR0647843.1 low temperature requirement protein A [Plastoroseomonas hellenica]
MHGAIPRTGLLRAREPHAHAKVSFAELFFDLVFVFAITQLSHALLADMSLAGMLRTGMLFLGVWWVWIYTAWVTNWVDPERPPARLMLFAMMGAGLVLSMSIPGAFGEKGLAFALAYVAMQVGRSAFMIWAIGPGDRALRLNFVRILAWLVLSGVCWIAGALQQGEARILLWAIALGIEYVSPAAYFWTPFLGRSTTGDWRVEGAHLAERCALFIIIALGESILVSGATFEKLPWDALHIAAFATCFLGTLAMWWIYFHLGAERGSAHIAHDGDPGRIARLGYTYLHLPIVAGIVLCAVSDEILLAHPYGHTEWSAAAAILGGPALYLAGCGCFKTLSATRFPLSHLVGLGVLAALTALVPFVWPLALGALATAALILVAAWEHTSLRGRRS